MARREHIPARLRHEVFQRDNYRCRECGATNKETTLEIDHIVPVSKGGSNNISNLQTLCKKCNRAKHTRTWVGGVRDNKNYKSSSSNHYINSNKSGKLGLNGLKYARRIPTKACPNCHLWMNVSDNICPICGWDIQLGRYHIPDEKPILNPKSPKEKEIIIPKRKDILIPNNIKHPKPLPMKECPKCSRLIKKFLDECPYCQYCFNSKATTSIKDSNTSNKLTKKINEFLKNFNFR